MRTLALEKLQETAARKRAEFGYRENEVGVPNSGRFRTPEKRRLLQALDDLAKASGRNKPFKANY